MDGFDKRPWAIMRKRDGMFFVGRAENSVPKGGRLRPAFREIGFDTVTYRTKEDAVAVLREWAMSRSSEVLNLLEEPE